MVEKLDLLPEKQHRQNTSTGEDYPQVLNFDKKRIIDLHTPDFYSSEDLILENLVEFPLGDKISGGY